MRALTANEARIFIAKMIKFQGNFFLIFLKKKITKNYFFKLQNNRVFFSSFSVFSKALLFSKKKIASVGSCIGRFNNSLKFYLMISALNFFSKMSRKYSILIDKLGQRIFLYGNHLKKKNLLEMNRNLYSNDRVIVFGKNSSLPLGFGEIRKNSFEILIQQEKNIIMINQADIGQYIRINNI